jgi:hypothetical protein
LQILQTHITHMYVCVYVCIYVCMYYVHIICVSCAVASLHPRVHLMKIMWKGIRNGWDGMGWMGVVLSRRIIHYFHVRQWSESLFRTFKKSRNKLYIHPSFRGNAERTELSILHGSITGGWVGGCVPSLGVVCCFDRWMDGWLWSKGFSFL